MTLCCRCGEAGLCERRLWAVFDGHEGTEAAHFTADFLPAVLASDLSTRSVSKPLIQAASLHLHYEGWRVNLSGQGFNKPATEWLAVAGWWTGMIWL